MSNICRLCLKSDDDSYSNLDTEEYKKQIITLIPEIDIDIVEEPVICSICKDVLNTAHTFKLNCLQIEEQLKNFGNDDKNKINLECFLKKKSTPDELLCDIEIKEESDCETQDCTLPVEAVFIEETVKEQPVVQPVIHRTMLCKVCKKQIPSRYLLNHMKSHITANYICVTCPEGFDQKDDFVAHRRKNHQYNLKCSVCKKTFFYQSNLDKHMKKHENDNKFRCRFCNLNTLSKPRLIEHLRVHTGERPFKCEFCEKAFAQSSTLSTHVKSVHGTDRPYICDVCGKSFPVRGAYGAHIKSHENVEKNFVCKTCGKSYNIASKLKEHERRHAGVKDVICEVCGKGFVTKASIRRHMLVHKGIRPHECPICQKRFSTNFNKKVHLQSCMRRNATTITETDTKIKDISST